MTHERRELGELEMVVGGSGDANDPIGTATGDVEESGKATPILF